MTRSAVALCTWLLSTAACGPERLGPSATPTTSEAWSAPAPIAPEDVVLEIDGVRFVGRAGSVERHDRETGIVTLVRAFGGRGGLASDERALFAADDRRGVLGMWPVADRPRVVATGLVAPVEVSLSADAVLVRERGGRVVRVPRPDVDGQGEILAPSGPPARR